MATHPSDEITEASLRALLPADRVALAWAGIQNDRAAALQIRAARSGDAAMMAEAVATYRTVLDVCIRERAPIELAMTQYNLGTALVVLGNLTRDAVLLREAVAVFRAALEVRTRKRAPMDWALTQNNLGIALRHLGGLTGDSVLLAEAVAAYRAALKEYSRERRPRDWAAIQTDLALTRQSVANLTDNVTGAAADASKKRAATVAIENTSTARQESPALPRPEAEVVLGSQHAAVGKDERAAERMPPPRAALSGTPERIDELLTRFLAASPQDKRRLLEGEGAMLLDPIAQAMLGYAAEQALAEGDKKRAGFFAGHAALLARCRDRSVAAAFAALEADARRLAAGPRIADPPEVLRAIISASKGDTRPPNADLGITPQVGELLARLRAANPPELRHFLEEEGAALLRPEVEAMLRSAAQRAIVIKDERAAAFTQLANFLAARRQFGIAKVSPARKVGKQETGGAAAVYRPMLSELQDLLADSAAEHDENNLKRRIVLCHRIAEIVSHSDKPLWAAIQGTLGSGLRSLGQLSGDAAVLRQAVASFDAARQIITPAVMLHDWAVTEFGRANALTCLGELTGDAAVLRQAVEGYDAALTVQKSGDAIPAWKMQGNRANALMSLFALSRDEAVLRQALAGYVDAEAVLSPVTMPVDWAVARHNSAGAVLKLGKLSGDALILRQAVAGFDAALEVFSREAIPANWATAHTGRADALKNLGDLAGDAALLDEAASAYRDALEVLDAGDDEDSRQSTASVLAGLLVRLDRHAEAVAVIVPAIARSDAAIMQASRSADGRARAVEQVGDLYGLLSLCRLQQEPPDVTAALEAAEAGRARLLADALALDETRIEKIEDPHRQQLAEARERYHGLRYQFGHGQTEVLASRAELSPKARAALQTELDTAYAHYLALCREHGVIRTPKPLRSADILAAVPKRGALVLPVLTETEAMAFVIADAAAAVSLPLPGLSRRTLLAQLNGEENWLGVYNSTVRDPAFRRTLPDGMPHPLYERWNRQLARIGEWVWDVLLGPLDAHLREVAKLADDAPVVLLPPGLLGLLPLHAAAPRDGSLSFGERWTVSHAPSVRALRTCRAQAVASRQQPRKLLAIIDPPGQPRLAGAWQEAEVLRGYFAEAERVMLSDAKATLPAVLRDLPSATYIHASTHGFHHPVLPQHSGLHLADEPLELGRLRDVKLAAARLVYLSACESGLAGVHRMPEEFTGLPAGFVAVGAAGVIASLWPVLDDTSYLLTAHFYEELFDENGNERQSPAAALRAAQAWLRTVTYGDLRDDFDADESGRYLLIGRRRAEPALDARVELAATARSASGQVSAAASDEEGTPPPILLRLGPDHERPFASAHEWAAFTATGA